MVRVSFLLAAALLAGVNGQARAAETLASSVDIRKFTDSVMANAGAGNVDGVVQKLRAYTAIPPAEFDVFAATIVSQQPTLLQRYGPATGYDFVREDQAGGSLIRLIYLEKHEKSALRWAFVFYRSEKGWGLSDFKFDGNILAAFPGGG